MFTYTGRLSFLGLRFLFVIQLLRFFFFKKIFIAGNKDLCMRMDASILFFFSLVNLSMAREKHCSTSSGVSTCLPPPESKTHSISFTMAGSRPEDLFWMRSRVFSLTCFKTVLISSGNAKNCKIVKL